MGWDWNQQPGESGKAFAAFICYKELGPERSVLDVSKKLGKQRTLIDRWCQRWKWKVRILALSDYHGEQERLAQDSVLREKASQWGERQQTIRERAFVAAERQINLAEQLCVKVEQLLKMPVVKQTKREEKTDPATGAVVSVHITEIHPLKVDPSTLLGVANRVTDTGIQMQRLAAGMSTEKSEITGAGGGPLVQELGKVVIVKLPDNKRRSKSK